MLKRSVRYMSQCLLAAVILCWPLPAQMTVTGSITGDVVDPAGHAVSNAKVTLTSVSTSESRSALANEFGVFTILAVQPDTYNLRVEQAGFKAYARNRLVVSANERVAIPDVLLQVGDVTETISVVAEAAQVQTDSSEHSATLTTTQVTSLTAKGREVVSMLRTIPGVQYQADQDSTGGSYGTGTPNIGGSFSGTNILAVDGVVSNDQGTPNVFSSVTTLDAIGEVKVLLNSYQAEYAGNGGPIVQVVTRGGGREIHGAAYEYIRNDAMNANDFFNNRNAVRRPRYRYNTLGGSLGGPVYIPGHWNQGKTKMFAFYNVEQALISTPGALNSYTMPTALERQGDFSQTLDVNNKLIPITDTIAGSLFPGNGNPNSTGSTFYQWFNTAAFAVPGKGDPGNAAKNSVRNPGVNNEDIALSKRFPVKGEKRYLTLRWEAYNTFNHTQYSGINTSARFDLTTGAQVNPTFGQVTSTRAPRIMQGSLRFTF